MLSELVEQVGFVPTNTGLATGVGFGLTRGVYTH